MGCLQLHRVRQQELGAGGAKSSLSAPSGREGGADLRHPTATFQDQSQWSSEIAEGLFVFGRERFDSMLVKKLRHGEYLFLPVEDRHAQYALGAVTRTAVQFGIEIGLAVGV